MIHWRPAVLAALVVTGLVGCSSSSGSALIHDSAPPGSSSVSGIRTDAISSLPGDEQAAVNQTIRYIDSRKTPPGPLGEKWGAHFGNFEGLLPGGQSSNSPYREYRVEPKSGSRPPGPRRIVVNTASGAIYYTWTHYGDSGSPAFVQVR